MVTDSTSYLQRSGGVSRRPEWKKSYVRPMWYVYLVVAVWVYLVGVAILEAATAPVAEDEESEGDEAAQQVPRACWRGGVCDEGIVTRRLGKERLTCSKCHKRHVG